MFGLLWEPVPVSTTVPASANWKPSPAESLVSEYATLLSTYTPEPPEPCSASVNVSPPWLVYEKALVSV